jgi:hypothetical protein
MQTSEDRFVVKQADVDIFGIRSRRSFRSQKQQKPVRNVSFVAQVALRFIPDIGDFTNEELSQVWYSEQELLQIKLDTQQLMEQAKQRKIPHTADELRGLHMNQKRQRRSARVMALTCVLDEQKRQARHPGASNPETLAKLYKSFAFSATQIAQKIAHEDAVAAAMC